jgi:hypothetical protein
MGAFCPRLEIGAKLSEIDIIALKQSITAETSSHDIVIYAKHLCPYCTAAVSELKEAGHTAFVIKPKWDQRSVSDRLASSIIIWKEKS